MEQNGTELKVLPLMATPTEANLGNSEATLIHRVRVSGVPNEAHGGLIFSLTPGVNEAK